MDKPELMKASFTFSQEGNTCGTTEFTLEEKMRAIFNSGDVVKIEKVLRTKNGEKHYKYVWNHDGKQTTNWFGFNTIDECVEDCLFHLTINSL